MKKETIIHKLDPRAKLLLAIIYTICALIFPGKEPIIPPLLLIFLSLIPFIIAGKMVREWLRSIRGLSFLILIIIILNTLFIEEKGFSFSLTMILRILIMISSFSIFFLTVDPNDFALSLISMKIPYEFAFSFSLAFRFIPTIANEAENIMDAQQSRGYEMKKSGMINQIKNLFPLLVPLIICSIKRAFNVAEALESRAFGSKKERTYYFSINFSLKDWIFSLYLLLFLAIFIVIRIWINYMPDWFLWTLPV
ncbi:MAG: Energy-coupling factor transporter transmembrane protein EcfT [Promethearchaeota archaeon]|nr:MAG: Energy-coupling factor transporter transmembrane protein EcfT [Candidatus Lokiarchaeota archaeon]